MVDEKVQQGKENGIMNILHDINSKVDKLAEIKANMAPVFIAASQPTSNMTLKELAW